MEKHVLIENISVDSVSTIVPNQELVEATEENIAIMSCTIQT